MICKKLSNNHGNLISALPIIIMIAAGAGLTSCSGEDGKVALQEIQAPNAEASNGKDIATAKTVETTTEQPAKDPASAARNILKNGYRLKLGDGSSVILKADTGHVANSGDVIGSDGTGQSQFALLTEGGQLIIINDSSMLPEEGYILMPYNLNHDGTGELLTLGLFQVQNGQVVQTASLDVDYNARFEALEYQGEGQYLLRALTHAPGQPATDAPDVPLEFYIQRTFDGMEKL